MRVSLGFVCLPLVVAIAGAQTPSFQPTFQVNKFPTGCPASDVLLQIVQGDFNGDHKPDLAILCNSAKQISVLLGDGSGGFKAPVVTPTPTGVTGNLVAADLNGDGKTDLLFTQAGPTASGPRCGWVGTRSGPSDTAVTLLSKGDGTFSVPFQLPSNTFFATFGAADVNGDGIPDLAANDGNSIGYMAGHKDGTLSAPTEIPMQDGQCLAGIQQIADSTTMANPI